jgi:L-glutamine-phosphate cytidylyltransferase
MKAVILAAGRGTRISRRIDGKPKCMLPLETGTTLIEYTADLLRASGIIDVTVVLGYRGDTIRDVLSGREVHFVENPFFDVTNSIASMWFARENLKELDHDCLFMNGDVFLSSLALERILAEKESPVLFYDSTRRVDADYRFQCQGDRLVKYGKDLTVEETSGEYIGCARLDHAFLRTFLCQLDRLIRTQHHASWWEDVLYSLSAERKIIVRDICGAFWGEVDYIEDYERIMAFYKMERPAIQADELPSIAR